MKRSFALIPLLFPVLALAQDTVLPSEGSLASILNPLKARSVGPNTMGGRIVELGVYERDPRIFYVASASGGLFKTENAGVTFKPVWDRGTTVSLGAVAVSQSDPNVVWIGTGEDTSRNSVAWGDGVYRSTDGGKTWQHMGLKETMHISRIAIDPRDPNVIVVGALGRLWGPNVERGIFRSTDGGKTWSHALRLDENTGCIDLDVDPRNPNVMVASMWERRRYAYDFVSGGPKSGIYKSTDAGKTWRKVSKGLPTAMIGRVGISHFRKDPKVLIATVEYKIDPKAEENEKPKRPADGGAVRNYAGGTFKSTDGGESWKRVNYLNPRPFYFSTPVQDPSDDKRIYVLADSMYMSEDAGSTFKTLNLRVHPDFHDLWINPNDNGHMIAATDGGVYETRDRGQAWRMLNGMAIGQYYAVGFDMRRPYWIYGGLQDNGSWGIPTQTTRGGVAYYDATMTSWGDGFHVQVDPTDWTTVYSESQGGAAVRVDMKGGPSRSIRPRGEQGERLRFNWSTPFILSPHNPRTIYFGANKLFKSVNRGDSYKAISPDLTTNDPNKQRAGQRSVTPEATGAEMHCTIITISESPMKQGLLYVGTDDGLVHVSKDDGASWSEIGKNISGLPRNTWCSRVAASKHVEGRVYATFDGHRSNDFKPYVYVSEDFGQTWKPLTTGLTDGDSMYVITEGERNPDLLFLGSEMGLRVSLDRGASWTKYRSNFPTVAVHDLKIHPRELDLVIGTHGRSIWTLDVSALERLTAGETSKDVAVFQPQDVLQLGRISRGMYDGDQNFMSPNSQPGTRIYYHLKQPVKGDVQVIVSDVSGANTQSYTGTNEAGLNVVEWNGRIEGRVAAPGEYRVTVKADGKEYTTSVRVVDASQGL